MKLLAGARRIQAQEGEGLELRLLSAWEVVEARREAATLVQEDRERAICANACLLARALERGGEPLFLDGAQLLHVLSVEQIASLSRQWAEFSRRENPVPTQQEVERLKKAWGTRLIHAFSGVCYKPSEPCPQKPVPKR